MCARIKIRLEIFSNKTIRSTTLELVWEIPDKSETGKQDNEHCTCCELTSYKRELSTKKRIQYLQRLCLGTILQKQRKT